MIYLLRMILSSYVRRSAKASPITNPSPRIYDIRDMRCIKSGIADFGVPRVLKVGTT